LNLSALLLVLLVQDPGPPIHHISGIPPVAWPETPRSVGEVVDEEFTLEWSDYDGPSPTGTVTVNWFYTNRMPRTFQPGVIPDDLTGEVIVRGIDEADLTNRYVWNTSTVAPGSYFIWSLIDEPPEEMALLRVVAFARGVVTIAHSGDEIHPAVMISRPDSPYYLADDSFRIEYEAFDPDGTATVTLEVSSSTVGENFEIIADRLPAVPKGDFTWNTKELSEGDWTIRAKIVDQRGLSQLSYSRFFLRVQHNIENLDAGVNQDTFLIGPPDSLVQTLDSGVNIGGLADKESGCSCDTVEPRAARLYLFLLAFLLWRLRRTQ